MIVKIIYRDRGLNNEVFYEGTKIYKDYHTSSIDRTKNQGLEFINPEIEAPVVRIMVCRGDVIEYTVYTNERVYLLNENGKTIERLN